MRKTLWPLLMIATCLLLAGCDKLGLGKDAAHEAEVEAAKAADRDNEGRAIGSACRQSGRALEDCFTLNPTASKSSVFNGWKDMNDYMMQNKIDVVKPEFPVAGVLNPRKRDADAGSEPMADEQSSAADDRSSRRRSRASSSRRHKAVSIKN